MPDYTPFVTRFSAPGRSEPIWYRDQLAQDRIDTILSGGVTYIGKVDKVASNASGTGAEDPTDGSTKAYYRKVGTTSYVQATTGDLFIFPASSGPDKEFIWNGSAWEEIGHEGQGAFAFVDEGRVTVPTCTSISLGYTATTTSFTGNYDKTTSATIVGATGLSFETLQPIVDYEEGTGALPSLTWSTKNIGGVTSVGTATISQITGVGQLPSLTPQTSTFNAVDGVTSTTISIIDGTGSLPTRQSVTVVTSATLDPGSLPTGTTTEISGLVSTWSAGTLPTRNSVTVVTSVALTSGGAVSVQTATVKEVGSLPSLTTKSSNYITFLTSDTSLAVFLPIEGLVSVWSAGSSNSVTVVTGVSHTAAAIDVKTKSIYEITGVGTLPSLTTTTQTISEFDTQGSLPSLTVLTKNIYEITGVGSLPTKKAQTVVTAVGTKSITAMTGADFSAGVLPTKSAVTVVTSVGTANTAAVTTMTWNAGSFPELHEGAPVVMGTDPEFGGIALTMSTITATLGHTSTTVTVSGKYDKTTSATCNHADKTFTVTPYTPSV